MAAVTIDAGYADNCISQHDMDGRGTDNSPLLPLLSQLVNRRAIRDLTTPDFAGAVTSAVLELR